MKRKEVTKTFVQICFKLKRPFGLHGLYTNILVLEGLMLGQRGDVV